MKRFVALGLITLLVLTVNCTATPSRRVGLVGAPSNITLLAGEAQQVTCADGGQLTIAPQSASQVTALCAALATATVTATLPPTATPSQTPTTVPTVTPTSAPTDTPTSTPAPIATATLTNTATTPPLTATPAAPTPTSDPPPAGFYAAPNGTANGTGALAAPWDLQTAFNQALPVSATLYLRGGTYTGKFTSNLTGATVRNYLYEWPVIDGYVTTTLQTALTASGTTVSLANAAKFNSSDVVVIAGTLEHILLGAKSGANFTGSVRGWDGTTAQSAPAGRALNLGGNNLTINGSDSRYMGFEVRNSSPVRVFTAANTQNAADLRGECIWHAGPRTHLTNLILHDCQDGVFSAPASTGSELYGLVIYNNGYQAAGAGHGHGLYMQNNTGVKDVRDVISFHNFNFGAQQESQTGNAIGMRNDGVIMFDNGAQFGGTSRNWNLLIGANNGIAADDEVRNSHFFHPGSATAGNLVKLGYSGANGALTVTNNVFSGGGSEQFVADGWTPFVGSGNTFFAKGTNSLFAQVHGLVGSMNNNTYYDQSRLQNCAGGSFRGPFNFNTNAGACGGFLRYAEWRTASGWDAGSTYTEGVMPNTVVVRPNAYEPGRAHIVVYNWSGATSVSVNLSAAGLANGQPYGIRDALNPFGAFITVGNYNPANPTISLSLAGRTVAAPVGLSAPGHTLPDFGVFILLPTGGP